MHPHCCTILMSVHGQRSLPPPPHSPQDALVGQPKTRVPSCVPPSRQARARAGLSPSARAPVPARRQRLRARRQRLPRANPNPNLIRFVRANVDIQIHHFFNP